MDGAVRIAGKVASALQAAHDKGIVHRDVKPGNILLDRRGEPRVADFGVALALREAGSERLTTAGLSVGTPAYMSPEQLAGEGEVDGRSDVYALGVLTYEMLSGRPPFEADSLAAVVARILTESPRPIREHRPEVPLPVAKALARALARDPEERFPSAADFGAAISAGEATTRPRSRLWGAAGVAGVVLVGAVGYLAWTAAQRAAALESLAQVESLLEDDRYVEAFEGALEAGRRLPGDPSVAALLERASLRIAVDSDPPGAEVEVQRFPQDEGSIPAPQVLGVTPIPEVRLPRADHRMVLRLPGYVPQEMPVSAELIDEALRFSGEALITLTTRLVPEDEVPPGMVPVPGGEYRLSSPDSPSPDEVVTLAPFFLDRFEVSNEAYGRFVTDGGYQRDELWTHAPTGVRAGLVDRTGLPGPREWSRQRFPDGASRLPVTGVTWWEAQAFCRSTGGRLPTVFEWEKTARAGIQSPYGVIMPWGLESAATGGRRRANFNSSGPVAVDAYPFGVSFFGAYGMAGNVREWTINTFGEGRAVTGGSWDGPAYLYSEYDDPDPSFASPSLGFRCARDD